MENTNFSYLQMAGTLDGQTDSDEINDTLTVIKGRLESGYTPTNSEIDVLRKVIDKKHLMVPNILRLLDSFSRE